MVCQAHGICQLSHWLSFSLFIVECYISQPEDCRVPNDEDPGKIENNGKQDPYAYQRASPFWKHICPEY